MFFIKTFITFSFKILLKLILFNSKIIKIPDCFLNAFITAFYRSRNTKNFRIVTASIPIKTRPAWAGFKTAEEGRTKIM
jgi:hypothetical protein